MLNKKFISIHCRWTRFVGHNTGNRAPLLSQSAFSSRFLALLSFFKVSKGTVAFGCCDFQCCVRFLDFQIGFSRFGNPVTFASCSTRHWAHPGQQLQIHNGNSQNQVPPPRRRMTVERNGKNQRMTIWMCQLERLNCNSRIRGFYKVGKTSSGLRARALQRGRIDSQTSHSVEDRWRLVPKVWGKFECLTCYGYSWVSGSSLTHFLFNP